MYAIGYVVPLREKNVKYLIIFKYMTHYAMIPMDEYKAFMDWKENRGNKIYDLRKKPATPTQYRNDYDDVPF